jgi:hypothetical protein
VGSVQLPVVSTSKHSLFQLQHVSVERLMLVPQTPEQCEYLDSRQLYRAVLLQPLQYEVERHTVRVSASEPSVAPP